MIADWFAAALILTGSLFMLIAAVGLVRFPDFYSRMHATSKSSSFGVVLIAVAVMLHFRAGWVVFDALLVIGFIYATVPVSSHLLARAAYCRRVPQWEGTVIDELKGRYDLAARTLGSGPLPGTTKGAAPEREGASVSSSPDRRPPE